VRCVHRTSGWRATQYCQSAGRRRFFDERCTEKNEEVLPDRRYTHLSFTWKDLPCGSISSPLKGPRLPNPAHEAPRRAFCRFPCFSVPPMNEVTRILSAVEQGDPHAAEQLWSVVYDELRQLAAQKLAQEKPGQTLQATALVHEAYLRLVANLGGE